MAYQHRTDFHRRYDTDKREMTIGEIREVIIANPIFRHLVELELISQSRLAKDVNISEVNYPFAKILTDHPVEQCPVSSH